MRRSHCAELLSAVILASTKSICRVTVAPLGLRPNLDRMRASIAFEGGKHRRPQHLVIIRSSFAAPILMAKFSQCRPIGTRQVSCGMSLNPSDLAQREEGAMSRFLAPLVLATVIVGV